MSYSNLITIALSLKKLSKRINFRVDSIKIIQEHTTLPNTEEEFFLFPLGYKIKTYDLFAVIVSFENLNIYLQMPVNNLST